MPEEPKRRAIVLIPGLQRVERFSRRDLLIENLQHLERRPMQRGEAVAVLGEAGRRVLPLPLSSAPYAFVTLLLASFKTDELAQMAQFSKDYLENRRRDAEVGLRDRIRRRVAETLERVLAEPYAEIVVVGHSFGSVIAIDLLAGWPHPLDRERLALVTLGSPEAVLACRSRWLDAEREKLFECRLAVWLDFHSPTDWLCTAVTRHRRHYPEGSRELHFEAPLLDRVTGRTHMAYYGDPAVLESLAAPRLD